MCSKQPGIQNHNDTIVIICYPLWKAAESGAAAFASMLDDPSVICLGFNEHDQQDPYYLSTNVTYSLSNRLDDFGKVDVKIILLGNYWVDSGHYGLQALNDYTHSQITKLTVTMYCTGDIPLNCQDLKMPNVFFYSARTVSPALGPCLFLKNIFGTIAKYKSRKHFWASVKHHEDWDTLITQIDDHILYRNMEQNQLLFDGVYCSSDFKDGATFFDRFSEIFLAGPAMLAYVVQAGQATAKIKQIMARYHVNVKSPFFARTEENKYHSSICTDESE